MDQQKLMAFWEYDRFPYALSSEVEKFDEIPGVVQVKGYGKSRFRYKHIMPFEAGSILAAELKVLKIEYEAATKEVYREYNEKLSEISKRYGLPVR